MPDPATPMTRRVSATLTGEVLAGSDLSLAIAVALGATIAEERLDVSVAGVTVPFTEVLDDSGVRRHVLTGLPLGRLVIDYAAVVQGHAPEATVRPIDPIEMTWPSRYCDSDRLANVARVEFESLNGKALVDAVVTWVNHRLIYVSGSSRVLDGATEIFLANEGVCRDFAHLVIALLRARGVPARLVSVYAPGLSPMDFHAVVEVLLDGRWYAVDATRMAPRASLLRIAAGRDAADTAFMTVPRGNIRLDTISILAVVDGLLPIDDPRQLVQLG